MSNKTANGKSHPSKTIIVLLALLTTILTIFPAMSQETPPEHPLKGERQLAQGHCQNCGMNLNLWARTRHSFKNSEGEHHTCSIRCLADITSKSGEKPRDVMAALYLHPELMKPADQLFYVVGSSAKGTMTKASKLAFATCAEASAWRAEFEGMIMTFAGALAVATSELSHGYEKIEAKRKKKGRIEEPDDNDLCTVCGMLPVRFPRHSCQIETKSGGHHHFCSTQCLINYLAAPASYLKEPPPIKTIWVKVPGHRDYEFYNSLYYLVGSKLLGPMGPEALPFRKLDAARENAAEHGGAIVRFKELKPELIKQQP